MRRHEYLLNKISEECAEVTQRVSKALCFGLGEVQEHPGANPDQANNAERIMAEYCDLLAMVEMCQLERLLPEWTPDEIRRRIDAKKHKVNWFMDYSRRVGTLNR